MKEYNKTYWKENKEKLLEFRRTKYNQKIKNYYLENKNNLLEKSKIYYENNKEYKKYYNQQYKKVNVKKEGMIITKDITLYFN